jgi:hypothetical protein
MNAKRIVMMSVAMLALAGCQPKSESESNPGGDKVSRPTEQPTMPAMTNSMETNNPSRNLQPATNAPAP